MSSNWALLKKKLQPQQVIKALSSTEDQQKRSSKREKDEIQQLHPKRRRTEISDAVQQLNKEKNEVAEGGGEGSDGGGGAHSKKYLQTLSLGGKSFNEEAKNRYVGLDCEMVGIGASGKESALARCCLVDFDGEVIYDQFVRPQGFVTDFRTEWSGVRRQDLRAGHAVTFSEVKNLIL